MVSEFKNQEIHEVDITDTDGNDSQIRNVGPQKAGRHYNPHLDSNTLTEIQAKVNELCKLYSGQFPVTTHKEKEEPKVGKCCYRCGQVGHYVRECPYPPVHTEQQKIGQTVGNYVDKSQAVDSNM